MTQLVLLCDGTNNNLTGLAQDTHVVLLAELLRRDPDAGRLVFYDPGVGNPGQIPGTTLWDKWRRQYQRIEGLAFGGGVYDNIAEGYRFLMQHWREGDAIYLFGFSRGAFTARSIAGMVNRFGILAPHQEAMLPTLLHVYFSDINDDALRIVAQARRLFGADAARPAGVHFVGVWDTVASVGLWPFDLKFRVAPTLQGKRFLHVRHALALDEQRAQFKPRLYDQANGSFTTADGHAGSIEQLWFRGAHCDVGGGYALEKSALARAPLHWLLSQAVQCGLSLHHQGRALADEPAVEAAVAELIPALTGGPDPATAQPLRVHSQFFATALWALTGMAQRDTRHVDVDGAPDPTIQPREHASVMQWQAGFPADTEWALARPGAGFWWALALVLLMPLALGQLLLIPTESAAEWWLQLEVLPANALAYLLVNADFQWWQLSAWWPGGDWWADATAFAAPRWAVTWDLLLIGAYAVVLARLATRGFASATALRRAGDPVSRGLNRLGWALPLAVFADLGENLFTWLTLTLGETELWLLAGLTRPAMAACALLKFAGLAGALWLALGAPGLRAKR